MVLPVPNWPKVDPVLAEQLFTATMAVLLAPKLMAYIALLFDWAVASGLRRRHPLPSVACWWRP